jgi:hypothetical protein
MITWLPYWASTVLAYLGLVTAAVMLIEVVVGLWVVHDHRRDPQWTEDDIS